MLFAAALSAMVVRLALFTYECGASTNPEFFDRFCALQTRFACAAVDSMLVLKAPSASFGTAWIVISDKLVVHNEINVVVFADSSAQRYAHKPPRHAQMNDDGAGIDPKTRYFALR